MDKLEFTLFPFGFSAVGTTVHAERGPTRSTLLFERHARLARTLSHELSGFPTHRRTSLTIQPASVSLDRSAGSRQYVSV